MTLQESRNHSTLERCLGHSVSQTPQNKHFNNRIQKKKKNKQKDKYRKKGNDDRTILL